MLIEKVNSQYPLCRIPGLVVTQNGTLIAYYECRSSLSDWAMIDIKIIISTDKGESWHTVKVIHGNGDTLNNPVMFVKENTVHLLYCKNYYGLFYCNSTDGGKSFSDPEDISRFLQNTDFKYTVNAVGPGHGIVHNGNLIVPIWFAFNKDEPQKHHPSFLRTLYSADDGKTWRLGEEIGNGVLVNPSEAALAVTADNEVLISIRNENPEKLRAFSVSENGFSNWHKLHLKENMPDPTCHGSMFHTKNCIYHINCNSKVSGSEGRVDLTVKKSTDNFNSYETIFISKYGGYSDIAVFENSLYVLYEKNILDPNEAGIFFERIEI